MQRIIDISVEISPDTVLWPGSNPFVLERIYSFDKNDAVNVSYMEINLHTGTHIDVPLHFIENGESVSMVDLAKFCGKSKVICLNVDKNVTEEVLKEIDIREGDIILLNIEKNNEYLSESHFTKEYIALSLSGAEYLVEKKIKAIGINYLTIGTSEVHTFLLKNDIAIIETLKLIGVEEGEYYFYGFPLKIRNGEGSPVRAVLIKEFA